MRWKYVVIYKLPPVLFLVQPITELVASLIIPSNLRLSFEAFEAFEDLRESVRVPENVFLFQIQNLLEAGVDQVEQDGRADRN